MATNRTNSSSVWTYMEKGASGTALCLVCKQNLKYSGSTSNLNKHLRLKHPTEHGEMVRQAEVEAASKKPKLEPFSVQPSIIQTFERTTKYKEGAPRKALLDKLLLRMIVEDLQPFSIVEDKGFTKFVRALDPKYEIPSRRTLTRSLLPDAFDKERARVEAALASAQSVALTTDLWTSRRTQGFLTVTCHFIDADWTLQSVVLSTTRMMVAHTAANIAEALDKVMVDWKIKSKVCAIVTDNASTMTLAVQKLGLQHMSCFAHTLNLVVKDSLKNAQDITDVRKKISAIVAFFNHSVKASDRLEEMQKKSNKGVKKLIQDVETRWNSTYYMIQRFLEQEEMVTTTLCLQGKTNLCLSEEEKNLMTTAISEQATRELSGEKFSTLSKVPPLLQSVAELLKQDSSPLTMELLRQLSKRFPNLERNRVVGMSTFLDPRFKNVAFMDQDAVLMIEQELLSSMQTAETDEGQVQTVTCEPAAPNTKGLWARFDTRAQEFVKASAEPEGGRLHNEMRRFKQERLVRRDADPLLWWQENARYQPLMQDLARQYLCIPATSVPSERLFSKAGELISIRRSCLKDNNVDMILFLNKNLRD